MARRTVFALVSLAAGCWSALALAGGGPERLLLVVNPQSPSSLTIANHYARLRAIPSENLLYLPWDPNLQTADIETFRQRILVPVLQMIEARRLTDQIDYVVYSSDFPWGIGLDSDVRKFSLELQRLQPAPAGGAEGKPNPEKAAPKPEWPFWLTPVGSLNGLTYLWQMVALGHPGYFEMRSNHYARPPAPGAEMSVGFRGDREYGPQGEVVASRGRRYFLSTMLGVTAGRGNSLVEVLDYLKRSAAADATHPKGTLYFVANADVRSKVRDALFPAAVRELKKLGVAAEVLEGTLPQGKHDVQGLVMGAADFDWKTSGSTILPGAICDNFTSYGGAMSADAIQTPLSVFLRYGAAGASGTVAEPRAIPAKFPLPMLQIHYARGCTLAEAFYQSVHCPYQLLIVGDPLCRPWANVPQVSAAGVEPGGVVSGPLTLRPTAALAGGKPVESFELYCDGLRVDVCKPGGTLSLDSANCADGYHELRVVAIGPPPIESQGRLIVPVWLQNHARTIEASLATEGPLRADAPLAIAVRSPESVGIIAIQGSRVVGRVAGEEGRIEIPAKTLGAGPVHLRVVGLGEGGTQTNVAAKPLEFVLE
jgi:hypothetical protein